MEDSGSNNNFLGAGGVSLLSDTPFRYETLNGKARHRWNALLEVTRGLAISTASINVAEDASETSSSPASSTSDCSSRVACLSPQIPQSFSIGDHASFLLRCPWEGCSQAYPDSPTLQSHYSTAHEAVKPHKCARCPRAFLKLSELQRHNRSVHGIRRAFCVCDGCGQVFSKMDALRRHRGGPWAIESAPAKVEKHACIPRDAN